jgi:hypothetical protein
MGVTDCCPSVVASDCAGARVRAARGLCAVRVLRGSAALRARGVARSTCFTVIISNVCQKHITRGINQKRDAQPDPPFAVACRAPCRLPNSARARSRAQARSSPGEIRSKTLRARRAARAARPARAAAGAPPPPQLTRTTTAAARAVRGHRRGRLPKNDAQADADGDIPADSVEFASYKYGREMHHTHRSHIARQVYTQARGRIR